MALGTDLTESMEDYLEVIYDLETTHKVARPKDIAEQMGVQRGSVTGALKSLNEKGLVNYQPYSFITLTAQGTAIAKEITRRHRILKDFLSTVMQLDPEKAEAIACRMEHAIDKAFIDRLVQFIDFVKQCPRTGEDWMQAFVTYCQRNAATSPGCQDCLQACLERYDGTASSSP